MACRLCYSVWMIGSVYGLLYVCNLFFFFKQKTAYEMRISDWSSDVCSSDLRALGGVEPAPLDAGRVGGARHDSAQRIDLAHQVEIGRASCRERVCQYV